MTLIFSIWRFYFALQLFTYQSEAPRYMYFFMDVTIWKWSAHIKVYKGRDRSWRERGVRIDCNVPLPGGYFNILPFQRVVHTCTKSTLHCYKIKYYSVFTLKVGKRKWGGIGNDK